MKNKLFLILRYIKNILGIKKYYLNKKNNWLEPFFGTNDNFNFNKYDLHIIHYFKWEITKNVSVRYFFKFNDRKDFQNNFILKDHKNHKSVLLHPRMAIGLINELGKYPEEIYGSTIINDLNVYKKISYKHSRKSIFNLYNLFGLINCNKIKEIIEIKKEKI